MNHAICPLLDSLGRNAFQPNTELVNAVTVEKEEKQTALSQMTIRRLCLMKNIRGSFIKEVCALDGVFPLLNNDDE